MADRDRPARAGDEDEGFLSRWSRRKAKARGTPAAPAPAIPVDAEDRSPAPETTPPASRQEARGPDAPSVEPEDLPDIESLDASSDFTVFMRPGVPAHLRTLALRKLWRSDPIFSKLDGLVEYGEDYTIPSWPKGTIKTAYRIGRGFVKEIEELEDGKAEAGPLEQPDDEAAPAIASSAEEAPAGFPADSPQSAPEPAASDEARPATSLPTAPAGANAPPERRRRPLPRRG